MTGADGAMFSTLVEWNSAELRHELVCVCDRCSEESERFVVDGSIIPFDRAATPVHWMINHRRKHRTDGDEQYVTPYVPADLAKYQNHGEGRFEETVPALTEVVPELTGSVDVTRLRGAIATLIRECENHNGSYGHVTPGHVLHEMRGLLDA